MRTTADKHNIGLGVEEIEETKLEHIVEGSTHAGMGIIMTMAALVGIWGLACLIGAFVQAGGLLEVGRAWFAAVTGM